MKLTEEERAAWRSIIIDPRVRSGRMSVEEWLEDRKKPVGQGRGFTKSEAREFFPELYR
jgi:hypothetical protein